jgi:hypothetical protein
MIHVNRAECPDDFDEKVRQPGMQFLRKCPRPRSKDWRGREYWRNILRQLHESYRGICAYSCHWIPHDTGALTVEHFVPRCVDPSAAYEWDNFRLVCLTLNTRKRTETILDPFVIESGLFILDFPSLLVKAAPGLPKSEKKMVIFTRDKLRLNDEGTCLKSRVKYVREYCDQEITFAHLKRHAPFIAIEMERQGIVKDLVGMMRWTC